MSRTQKGSSLASLALAVLGFVYLIDLSSGSAYYLKRNVEGADCVDHGGMDMERTVRNGNLDSYLIQMVRCLAAASRPRFGKRNGGQHQFSKPTMDLDDVMHERMALLRKLINNENNSPRY